MYDQQGDVLLKKVDKLPNKRFKTTQSKKVVLAEGEQTGHNHVLLSPLMPVSVNEINGEVFIEILSPSEVVHQEHNKIVYKEAYDPGIYKIEIVKEYDHFLEEAKRILD